MNLLGPRRSLPKGRDDCADRIPWVTLGILFFLEQVNSDYADSEGGNLRLALPDGPNHLHRIVALNRKPALLGRVSSIEKSTCDGYGNHA